jgi:anti-sigma B factor antagonist
MELDIPDLDVDGWTVVAASGEIDVATAPALRDRLAELVEDGTTRLVIDLEDVDFIDSTGLGVLVGGLRRARGEGGDLRLVCTNPRILKVFEATGLHDVFAIEATVDDAVADRRE